MMTTATGPKLQSPRDLDALRAEILAGRDAAKLCVTICSGTGCRAYGSEAVHDAFAAELKKQGLDEKVDMRRTGCHGFCERGTVVVIFPEEICYLRVRPEDVPEIVGETLANGRVVERLLYEDDQGQKIVHEGEIPFYKLQSRTVFGNNKFVDPKNIDDYIALGGYAALAQVLTTVRKITHPIIEPDFSS